MRVYLGVIVAVGVVSLMGCGGGGGSQIASTVPSLNSVADTYELQAIELGDTTIQQDLTSKSDLETLWDEQRTFDYVGILANGNIIGVPSPSIPNDMSFSSSDSGFMEIVMPSARYILTNGDVSGSLSGADGTLDLTITWSDTEIEYFNEDRTPIVDHEVAVTLQSTSSGAGNCGLSNQFCGGSFKMEENGTVLKDGIILSKEQLTVGVFGSNANDGEIGGRLNYSDQDALTAIGSFIAESSN